MLALIASSSVAFANDIVITGGRVIDPETGLDAIRNVAVDDGKIVAISEFPLQGDVTVDAAGHVVSPGFIDMHSHGNNIGDCRMQVIQGVTTALELESGLVPIGDRHDGQAKKNLPMNCGASAGWILSRIATFSDTDPLATAAFFTDAQGHGHKEYLAPAELAKTYNVPTFTHVRYASNAEPQSAFEAIQELIGLAAITGAHMHLRHINSTSLSDIKATMALVEEAQAKGINVTTEAYPFGAASTVVGRPCSAARTGAARWSRPPTTSSLARTG